MNLAEWAEAYTADASYERSAMALVKEAFVNLPSEFGDTTIVITGPGKVRIAAPNSDLDSE